MSRMFDFQTGVPCTCSQDDGIHEYTCAIETARRIKDNTKRHHDRARERYEERLQEAREAQNASIS